MEPFKASEGDWQVIESESQKTYTVAGAASRTILELRDRVAALEATAAATTPPPAEPPGDPQTLHTVALAMVDTLERLPDPPLPEILDTLRRAIRGPVVADGGPLATDGEIAAAANQCLTAAAARRAIYNLGRQHVSPTCPHIRQGDSGSQYCDLARQTAELAPLPPLEAGQKWRRRDGVVVEVERCVGLTTNGCTTGWAGEVDDWWYIGDHKFGDDKTQSHPWDLIELVEPAPTPVKLPEPDGVPLVTVIEDIYIFRGGREGDPLGARRVIHAVADWIEARYDMISNGHDCENLLRREAGR
jgi:hypothetical protein